ncbi:MAG TPA: hypothetical protein DDY77_05175 [Clostridiales bacterium]|nr:hypothetical protein [Clostridiales bacterium]
MRYCQANGVKIYPSNFSFLLKFLFLKRKNPLSKIFFDSEKAAKSEKNQQRKREKSKQKPRLKNKNN